MKLFFAIARVVVALYVILALAYLLLDTGKQAAQKVEVVREVVVQEVVKKSGYETFEVTAYTPNFESTGCCGGLESSGPKVLAGQL